MISDFCFALVLLRRRLNGKIYSKYIFPTIADGEMLQRKSNGNCVLNCVCDNVFNKNNNLRCTEGIVQSRGFMMAKSLGIKFVGSNLMRLRSIQGEQKKKFYQQ